MAKMFRELGAFTWGEGDLFNDITLNCETSSVSETSCRLCADYCKVIRNAPPQLKQTCEVIE